MADFKEVEPLELRCLPDDGHNDPRETLRLPGGIIDFYGAIALRDWLNKALGEP